MVSFYSLHQNRKSRIVWKCHKRYILSLYRKTLQMFFGFQPKCPKLLHCQCLYFWGDLWLWRVRCRSSTVLMCFEGAGKSFNVFLPLQGRCVMNDLEHSVAMIRMCCHRWTQCSQTTVDASLVSLNWCACLSISLTPSTPPENEKHSHTGGSASAALCLSVSSG